MGIKEALAMLTTIIVIAGSTSLAILFYDLDKTDPDVGFGTHIEKTAQSTESDIEPTIREMKIEDVGLMMLLLDSYTPGPDKIEVSTYNISNNLKTQTQTYDITEQFLNERAGDISNLLTTQSSNLPSNHYVKYVHHADITGATKWEFQIWK